MVTYFERTTWSTYPWHTLEVVWFDGVTWRKRTIRRYYKGSDWNEVESTTMTLLEAIKWLDTLKKGEYTMRSRVA